MKKNLLLGFLILTFFNTTGQTIKTFTRNDAEIKTDLFTIYNGKETYSYYEDDNGNYVKNGAYSLTGSNTTTINSANKASETYKASATFKKNVMNGTLTISFTYSGISKGKAFNSSKSFTAGYLNGIPNGKWVWKDNTKGVACSSEMNFTKGILTGLYKYDNTQIDAESYTKKITKLSGSLNTKGEFNGTWSITEAFESVFSSEKTNSEMIFSNGILLSCIQRDATGKLLNPDQDRATKKALATKFANGEITEQALYDKGYIFKTGKIKLYCPDLNNIGGDKLDSVICGKPYKELTKVELATDSLISEYEEVAKKEVDQNLEWGKQQKNMSKVLEKYSFDHFYRSEEIGASLSYKYNRYYLNKSQIAKLDTLKSFIDKRIDSVATKVEEERLLAEQQKIAQEQKIAAEILEKAKNAAEREKLIVENCLNNALNGIITISKDPKTKILGFDILIANKCNTNENWRNLFVSSTQAERYKKIDGTYGVRTPQEIMLKSLFSNLHPIVAYQLVSYSIDDNGIYSYLVKFEHKKKKKEPSIFYQGTIYVTKNGEILLDYSMQDIKEVTSAE